PDERKEREREREHEARAALRRATHRAPRRSVQGRSEEPAAVEEAQAPAPAGARRPTERVLRRGRSWDGDLRTLPQSRPVRRERRENEGPDPAPRFAPGPLGTATPGAESEAPISITPDRNAPAPAPLASFDGLDFGT